MIKADGTKDKSKLGANAILAVSIASCKSSSQSHWRFPLYRFLGGVNGNRLPVPMMNILNGGAHAANTVDVQEFMIMPVGAAELSVRDFSWCTEVFHALAASLKDAEDWQLPLVMRVVLLRTLEVDEEAIECILEAVKKAGYEPGKDFVLAMDAASSEWKGEQEGRVHPSEMRQEVILPKSSIAALEKAL